MTKLADSVRVHVVAIVADAVTCWRETGVGLARCASVVAGTGVAAVRAVPADAVLEHDVSAGACALA